jgi:hypothetical protein
LIAAVADCPALRGEGVAVIGAHRDLLDGVQRRQQVAEDGRLILRERLGGEQVEGAGLGILKQRLKDRQVVAQRLTGGRTGDNDHVLAGQGSLDGRGLVGVERRGAALPQRGHQSSGEAGRRVGVARRPGRQPLPRADVRHEGRVAAQPF